MNIRQYTGGWKRDNIRSICSALVTATPKAREYREKSKIIRRGRVLEDGSILWMQDGKLSIEKKGN